MQSSLLDLVKFFLPDPVSCWRMSYFLLYHLFVGEDPDTKTRIISHSQDQIRINEQTSLHLLSDILKIRTLQDLRNTSLISKFNFLENSFFWKKNLAHFQDFWDPKQSLCLSQKQSCSQSLKIAVIDILLKIQLWFSSQLPLKYYWVLALQMPGRWHGQIRLLQQENILKAAGHKSHRYPPLEIRNRLLNVR